MSTGDTIFGMKIPDHVKARISAGDLPFDVGSDGKPTSANGADTVADTSTSADDLSFLLSTGDDSQKAGDTTPAATTKRKVSYEDFLGDKIEEEIDVDAELPALAAARKRVKDLEEEMKALRDEVEGKSLAAQKKMEKAQKYLELDGKSPSEIIEFFMAKTGGFDAFRKQLIEEHAEYSKMSPEEQKLFDAKRVEAESIRRLKEVEARLAEKEKRIRDEEAEVSRKAKVESLRAVFNTYRIQNPDNDKALESINKAIFEEAQAGLSALQKSGVTLTDSILHREFRKAAQLFRSKIAVANSGKVDGKKEVMDQLDANAAKGQTLGTTTTAVNAAATSNTDKEQMSAWLEDIRAGRVQKVVKDAYSSPKKTALYERLAAYIQANPTVLRK